MTTINILAVILLGIFSLGLITLGTMLVKSALAAGVHSRRLIWTGAIVAFALIVYLDMSFCASLNWQGAMEEKVERVAKDNKNLGDLKEKAPELLALREKVELSAKLTQSNVKSLDAVTDVLTNQLQNIGSKINDQGRDIADLQKRIAQFEKDRGSSQTVFNDRQPVIQLAPPAPVLPSTADLEKVLREWQSRNQADLAKQLADLRQLPRDNTSAATLAALGDSIRQAQQRADEAHRLAIQLAAERTNDRDVNAARVSELGRKVDANTETVNKLILLWNTVPTATVQPQPVYTPPPAAPTPAPAAWVSATVQQPPQPTADTREVSFWVSNRVSTAVWKKTPLIPIPWWRDTATVTYIVKVTCKPGDSPEAAKNLAMETIKRFHNSEAPDVIRASRKDPKEGHDELVRGFVEAKAKVLKGQPGLEHVKLAPYYTLGTVPPTIPTEML